LSDALQFVARELVISAQAHIGGVMKLTLAGILVIVSVAAYGAENRPRITGIDHVDFYTTSTDVNAHLYVSVLGLGLGSPIEPRQTQRFLVGPQWVGYSPAPDPETTNRLDHIAFTTEDCAALRSYLAAKGIAPIDAIKQWNDGKRSFMVKDPEGHAVEFVEHPKSETKEKAVSDPVSRRMIHTGFIVHNRAAEDHFYKDVLGFHLYWYGGMQADRTDWVAMQVPEGTDWLEYMLNIKANPDPHTTGVMNHISLGVADMKQAQAKLESHGWKPHGDEHSQLGKDGKWQLNVFDPDLTRVELMEFKPVEKPCCSDFQGQHPQEP
jgi:catechol 2,3-dioxygenase-like lactoylglutathione lyase family enzyme